jgi:hypothetical protein
MDIYYEWKNHPYADGVLSKKFGYCLGLYQFTGLVQVVVNNGFGFDTEGVVDGCEKLRRVHRRLNWSTGSLIALAVYVSPFDSSTCDDGGIAIWPVIAAVIAVSVPTGAYTAFWGTTKLTDSDEQGVFE